MPGEIAATAAVEDLPPTDAFDGRPRFFTATSSISLYGIQLASE